jgi:phage gp36-like protein
LACDLARYQLFAGIPAPADVQARRDEAITLLRRINAGEADLGLDAASEQTAPTQAPETTTTEDDRVFTKTLLDDY